MSFRLLARARAVRGLLLVAAIAPAANAQEVPPTDDGYVFLSTGDSGTEHGREPTLVLRADQTAVYLRFDLPALPDSADPGDVNAVLRLFVSDLDQAGTLSVFRLDEFFDEGAAFDQDPLPLGAVEVMGVPIAGDGLNRYAHVDLTALVRGWYAGTVDNLGIALVGADGLAIGFDSKENDKTGHEPQLQLVVPGPAGAVGAEGPQGTAGPDGPQGPIGPDGPQGPIGAAGAAGPMGEDGDPGPIGPTGDQGQNGAAGAIGPTGAQGNPGAAGPTGAKGVIGPAGAAGPVTELDAVFADNNSSQWGIDINGTTDELIGVVRPPIGEAIDAVRVYAEDANLGCTVFKVLMTNGAATLLGSGTAARAVTFPSFAPAADEYLAIRLDTNSVVQTVYGAHVGAIETQVQDFFDVPLFFFNEGGSGSVVWNIDATPVTVLGNPSFLSGGASLNLNDGVDYANGNIIQATARSTSQAIPNTDDFTVTFRCNYSTETTGTSFDKRFFEVTDAITTTTIFSAQLATVGPVNISACAAQGTFHEHTVRIPVNPGSDGVFQFAFRFDSVDAISNNFAGWFVEDFRVDALTPNLMVTPDSFQGNDD